MPWAAVKCVWLLTLLPYSLPSLLGLGYSFHAFQGPEIPDRCRLKIVCFLDLSNNGMLNQQSQLLLLALATFFYTLLNTFRYLLVNSCKNYIKKTTNAFQQIIHHVNLSYFVSTCPILHCAPIFTHEDICTDLLTVQCHLNTISLTLAPNMPCMLLVIIKLCTDLPYS